MSEMSREEYIKLADSCDFLEKYQREQAADPISLFRGKRIDRCSVHIYLVSDPKWQEKMLKFTADGRE